MAEITGTRIQDGVCAAVGNTPLVRLVRLVPEGSADIYAKLEFPNPSGSVKDRIATAIIADAEQRGILKAGVSDAFCAMTTPVVKPAASNPPMIDTGIHRFFILSNLHVLSGYFLAGAVCLSGTELSQMGTHEGTMVKS